MPALLLQGGPEARQIFGFWILPDGAGDPLHGVIVMLRPEPTADPSDAGFRVTGIDRQRLLATVLRIEISTGPQMAEARLMQRVGRRSGRTR